jgi:putative CocE/NonD family hydrolase
MKKFIILLILCFVIGPGPVRAQDANQRAEYIRSHFTKFEYRIPMRDGVKLFTAVYIPNDDSKQYPLLMTRTPYGIHPYGADLYRGSLGPSQDFEKEGFIFVLQDVRGRYLSEGEFVTMRPHNPSKKSNRDIDESTDTYDTVEWLVSHIKNHNSRVGLWGVSYPGFFSSTGMIDTHPALKAVSPQAPVANFFGDDVFHNGAFMMAHIFRFYGFFKKRGEPSPERVKPFEYKTPDGYKFFLEAGTLKSLDQTHFKGEHPYWNEMKEHPCYDDFWKVRNILPHLNNIKAAVMVVGGWYDAEDLFGPLNTYWEVERRNPGISNVLVMGPWVHGGWVGSGGESIGDAEFGFKTSEYYQKEILLPFFKHHLKDPEGTFSMAEATVFETGANRWRKFDSWPPKGVDRTRFFLQSGGKLSFSPPEEKGPDNDSYISDPSKPVPFTELTATGMAPSYMTEDQRFAARRPDVLVYETETLKDDVTLAGAITIRLFASTTGTDSDFMVKLIDVFPDDDLESNGTSGTYPKGAQQLLIRGDAMRGRYRESFEKPKPFTPNKIEEMTFPLQDVFHTFKRNHRIMIHVQSTWFPLIDRNPQTFVPNIFLAEEKDFVTVTNRIYRSKEYPSSIEVGVLKQ